MLTHEYLENPMLNIDNAALLVIDVQERLFRAMYEKETLAANLEKLLKGARVLGLPLLVTEQYPRGLGQTIPGIAALIGDVKPVEKMCFSCFSEAGFLDKLNALKRRQILVTGIEAHVCVYQTAADMLSNSFEVQVVADCVSSRTNQNRKLALKKMGGMGIGMTSVEMALFELLKTAQSEHFKEISNIVK